MALLNLDPWSILGLCRLVNAISPVLFGSTLLLLLPHLLDMFVPLFAQSFVNLSALYSSFSFIGPLGKLKAALMFDSNVIA